MATGAMSPSKFMRHRDFGRVYGKTPMETPKLDLLLADDDFGGPTLVDPQPCVAHGTPPAGIVTIAKPRAIAAMAAANPRAMRVRNVIKHAGRAHANPVPRPTPDTSVTGEIVRLHVEQQLASATT